MCVCARECFCAFAYLIFQCSLEMNALNQAGEICRNFFSYFIFIFSSFRIVGRSVIHMIQHFPCMLNGEWRMANLHICTAMYSSVFKLMNAWWNCKCFFWLTARWSSSSTSGGGELTKQPNSTTEKREEKEEKCWMLNFKGGFRFNWKCF